VTDWLSAAELEALFLSLRVATIGVVCALPFAVAAALLLARHRFPGVVVVEGLILLPMILPPVVVGYLLLITFGTQAPLGAWLLEHLGLQFVFTWKGAVLVGAIMTFPFQVRAIRLAIEAIDPGLQDAAETLGAGPLDRFLSITLPLALPGIVAGAITAFAGILGEFGAVITFVSNIPGETRTLPLAIYTALQTPGGETAAARLAALSIVLALAGLILSEIAARRVKGLTR
jgi:molybdate transport system permease protein